MSTARVPVPSRIEDLLDPRWLSSALDGLADGDEVVDVALVDESATIASKVRFEAIVARPDGTRTRRAYCAKGRFGEAESGGQMVETRVYRDLVGEIPVRTPRTYYAGIDETTGHAVVIMEDIVAEGGTFLSASSPYPLDTTRSTLAQLAGLHAATWSEERRVGLDWMHPARVATLPDEIPTSFLQQLLDDGRGPDLPPHLRDAEKVAEAMRRVAARQRVCVVHGDTHSGNVYLDRSGRPCWLDWQITHIGHWATDVAYHITTVLDTETRRRHERDLLREYLDEVALHGQEPPPWEEAWEQYTRHIAYGYFLWSITRISSRAVVLVHVPRIGAALVDHDTFARLGL